MVSMDLKVHEQKMHSKNLSIKNLNGLSPVIKVHKRFHRLGFGRLRCN
jgi:hypothetical protein